MITEQDIIAAAPQLAEELETYYARKAELLQTARGKYVVIKGKEIIGLFDDQDEAFRQAYRQLGLTSFLLREVSEGEKVYTVGGSALDWQL